MTVKNNWDTEFIVVERHTVPLLTTIIIKQIFIVLALHGAPYKNSFFKYNNAEYFKTGQCFDLNVYFRWQIQSEKIISILFGCIC